MSNAMSTTFQMYRERVCDLISSKADVSVNGNFPEYIFLLLAEFVQPAAVNGLKRTCAYDIHALFRSIANRPHHRNVAATKDRPIRQSHSQHCCALHTSPHTYQSGSDQMQFHRRTVGRSIVSVAEHKSQTYRMCRRWVCTGRCFNDWKLEASQNLEHCSVYTKRYYTMKRLD